MSLRRLWHVIPLRLRSIARRGALDEQLDEEIHYHIERETAYRVSRGESPAEARAHALRDFGGVERYRDESRDARGVAWFDALARDVRFALRGLARAKAFMLVAVLTLALGIGANTAVYSLIDAVLLHPLNVARADRLVAISQELNPQNPHVPLSYPHYRGMAERTRTLDGIAAFSTFETVVATASTPEQLETGVVSGNYFEVLGVRPQVGRMLSSADDGAPGTHPVVVISDALWTRAFNRGSSAIGSSLRIGGTVYTIVGVAPRGFRGTVLTEAPQLWVPAGMLADLGLTGFLSSANRQKLLTLPHFLAWSLVGRLHEGATLTSATTELNTIYAQERAAEPKFSASMLGFTGTSVENRIRLVPINDDATWGDRDNLVRFMWILWAVVVITLMIACFNLANLLLVRNAERSMELGLRSSLGASRARIVQQLAVESLILGLGGAASGLLVSRVAIRLLASYTLPGSVRLQDLALGVNGRVLAVTIALGVVTSLIFGVAPVVQASRTDLIARLRGVKPSGRSRMRAIVLGAEVALSIVLLIGAGLFVRTMQNGLRTDLGFNPAPLVALRVNPALSGDAGAMLAEFYQTARERAAAIPGVTGVAMTTHVPLERINQLPFTAADRSDGRGNATTASVSAGWTYVSPEYFDVIGVPVLEGRAFTAEDSSRQNSAVILNQAAAHALFPDGHPLGRVIDHAGMYRLTVVGVVRDTKYTSVRDSHVPMVFTPMGPAFEDAVELVVRANRPAVVLGELRRTLQAIPPHPPLQNVRLVADQVSAALEPQRFGATLLGAYSLLALVIASIGMYGLVAFVVGTQHREIGIRLALGAESGRIVSLVTSRVAIAVVGGVAVGFVVGVFSSQALARFLYDVAPTDPATFAMAGLAMIVAALTACAVPVRRALNIDPVRAIRTE